MSTPPDVELSSADRAWILRFGGRIEWTYTVDPQPLRPPDPANRHTLRWTGIVVHDDRRVTWRERRRRKVGR